MTKYLIAIRKLVKGDPMTRFEVMKHIANTIFPTYRFKWPQMDWWNNQDFTHYLKKFDEHKGMNTDRRWVLSQLMRLTHNVAGDTAECGAYLGAGSYLICQFNTLHSNNERQHFIFDSFEGLSEPGTNDNHHWSKGDLSAPEEAVRKALADFPNITYLKGWIPSRFAEVENRKFSFIHIDVDLHEPTRECIAFFYPRMNPGGIILCDDYGFSSCPGATKAIDEFLENKPEKMISLCSGGGFMIKGCLTQG